MTSLAQLTTLRVGGTPSSLVIAATEDEIIKSVSLADQKKSELLILGGGSNLLVADNFSGQVLKINSTGFENDSSACAGAWVTVQAGHNWDDFVLQCVANGWLGVEALSGIPGTVGATPIQNVGAYGQQVSETIAQVRAWNRETNQIDIIFANECEFGYRTSVFKKHPNRWVILSVTFALPLGEISSPIKYNEIAVFFEKEIGDRVSAKEIRAAVLKLRAGKGMLLNSEDHDSWSVGSFFMNPRVIEVPDQAPAWPEPDGTKKVSAAWLIEQAGFAKGFGLNDRATLSTKHTLAITNRGSATSTDVLELARHIRAGVQQKFGIELKPEAQFVGCTL
jgi:UDP-N-acetylmuramate dehydrogenase